MTTLQARLLAARAVRAARAQEHFARLLRPGADIPAQRAGEPAATPTSEAVRIGS